jgi:hypothetical protein
MKPLLKKALALLLPLSLILSLTACNGTSGAADPVTTISGEMAATEGLDATETTVRTVVPADISGEISEIIGNEITVRLYAEDETITEESRVPGSGRGAARSTEPKDFSGESKTLIIPVGTLIVKRVRQTEPSTPTGETGTGTGPIEEPISLSDLFIGAQIKIFYKDGTEQIEKVVIVPSLQG